jgi:hypothetical protein
MTDTALVAKTADALQQLSRDFYEHSKFKALLSIVYAGAAVMLLGLCAKGQKFIASQFECFTNE